MRNFINALIIRVNLLLVRSSFDLSKFELRVLFHVAVGVCSFTFTTGITLLSFTGKTTWDMSTVQRNDGPKTGVSSSDNTRL